MDKKMMPRDQNMKQMEKKKDTGFIILSMGIVFWSMAIVFLPIDVEFWFIGVVFVSQGADQEKGTFYN